MAKETKKSEERRPQARGGREESRQAGIENIGQSREGQARTESGERGEREGQRGLQRQAGGGMLPQTLAFQNPLAFMRRFTEEMDDLFEDFLTGGALQRRGEERGWLRPFAAAAWVPEVETFQRNGELVVRADLPGLKKEDIQVEFTDEGIIIQGERRQEREEKKEGWYQSERSYGQFYRLIPLPEGVNPDQAKATFENGVLEVTMPAPKQERRGRRVEIQAPQEAGRKTGGREEAA